MPDEQKQAQVLQLPPGDLIGFEYISTRWDAKIAHGVTPEALERPEFWAHQAMQLKPFDEIRARAEDGTWIAYFVVLDCSRTWAKVKLDRLMQLTTADVSITAASPRFIAEHTVLWRGPTWKWSVVRNSDRSPIHDGEPSKADATAWLERHARTTQAALA